MAEKCRWRSGACQQVSAHIRDSATETRRHRENLTSVSPWLCGESCRLEMKLQSKLQDARIGRVVDRSKRRGAQVRVRVVEVRMIDGVERLEPRFEPHP